MTKDELVYQLQTLWAYQLYGLGIPMGRFRELCEQALDSGIYFELFREINYDSHEWDSPFWLSFLDEYQNVIAELGATLLAWPMTEDSKISALKLIVFDKLSDMLQTPDEAMITAHALFHELNLGLDQQTMPIDLYRMRDIWGDWWYFRRDDDEHADGNKVTAELCQRAQHWLNQNKSIRY